MRTITFADLDDSLISGETSGRQAKTVGRDRSGNPTSFQSIKQITLLKRLLRRGHVVPTTGRNIEAYRKLKLPFDGHAICAFGGVILEPNGDLNEQWHSHVKASVRQHQRTFTDIARYIAAKTSYVPHVISDGGARLYLKLDYTKPDASALELAQAAAALGAMLPPGWQLYRNGYHCCLQPPYIGKEKAVAWFLENLAGHYDLVIGLGDSFVDAKFMGICDFALMPTQSQLFSALLQKNEG